MTNARNTGDIIGTVTHEGFKVNKLYGLKAVFFFEHLGGIDNIRTLGAFCGNVAHTGVLADKLQRIPVAGYYGAIHTFFAAYARHGTKYIVSFPAGLFIAVHTEKSKQLLHIGHLHGKLIGHTLALCLVTVIPLAAEGGLGSVKSDAYTVRLLFIEKPEVNIHKSENRIRGQTLGV